MALWKARTVNGVRVYFSVVDNTGFLIAGIAPASFTALLITPNDAASLAMAVAPSIQRAGVYYCDIPAAFITVNGVGAYGLSLGVHSVVPPVNDETLLEVEVTVNDYDQLTVPLDPMTLPLSEKISIGDEILKRDLASVEAGAAIHSLCSAALKLVSRFDSRTGRTYRTDGITLQMTQTPIFDPNAIPIVELGEGI